MSTASVYCDSCGAANRVQARFCIRCGQALQHNAGEPHQANPPQQASGAPTGRLLPETLLGGRYRVQQVLGQGGMGAVYQVEDSRLSNARRAVKEMSQRGLSPEELPEAQEAFKREAHLLATLVHPNLPRISDYFSDNGRWYLVMDYIEGETLADRLSKTQAGKLPLDTVLELGIELCTVLNYLHSRPSPIIFRDLKPSNIMLTADEHLYLIDFGIARLFKPGKTKDTTAYGSPGYAAPEQYGRMQTSACSDLYSLGATLHQLVSGDNPDDMPFRFPPLHLQDEVGGTDLETLILRMVEMDPQKRPATALAVKQELQQLMEHRKQAILHPSPVPGAASPITFTVLSGAGDLKWIAGEPYYAVGYGDGLIQVWQCATNQLVSTCYGHTASINRVAWSPDGTRLASTSDDGTVRIWKAMTSQSLAVASRPGATQYHELAWSPDGTRLAVSSHGKYGKGVYEIIDIINGSTGSIIASCEIHDYVISRITWFSDGTCLTFIGLGPKLHIIEATTDLPLTSYKLPRRPYNGEMIYSPDCRYLAMVAEETMQMEIREITTGHVIASYKVSDIIKCIAWSSDSRYLAFALKEAVLVREALTGRLVASYTGHKDQVDSIAWHPFDTRIASSSAVDKTIQLWEAIKGSHLATHSIHSIQGGKYIDVGWTPDGTQLIFGSSHATVQVLKRATGQVSTVYRGHDSDVFTVAWSPDGTKIASGSVDKTVQVWHAQTGRCLATHTHSYIANTIAWSPDSQQIASRCVGSQEIHVWNAKTGRHLVTYIARESSGIHAVAWSPNGRFLATLSDENPESIVEIWEVTTKQLVTSYTPIDYERFDNSIAWSPDSMQIASSAASFVIWSPNGRYIASTGPIEVYELFSENTIGYYKPASDDHPAIQVWDTTTDSFHAICQGTALVKSAAWSPDGNYIAAGHTDRVVRIWEIATGRLIATHSGYVSNPEGGITWSPDGNYLAYTAYLDEIQTYPGAS